MEEPGDVAKAASIPKSSSSRRILQIERTLSKTSTAVSGLRKP